MMIEPGYLKNHFLIAMPALVQPDFFQTVTYICEHNSDGAMGIIINRPLTLSLGEILNNLNLNANTPQIALQPVYLGGPVHRERVFIIHEMPWQGELTLPVTDFIGVTASRDILAAMAHGEYTGQTLVALGYAGWAQGQLEQEMAANAWLSQEADQRILFDTPDDQRWQEAAKLLGIDISRLSGEIGHA